MVKPLTYISNPSIRSSKFSNVWKISKITPIPKTADTESVTKYRLIALLPIPAKIFEAVIYKGIFFQVETRISDRRGFVAGKSVQYNLLNYTRYNFTALQSNLQIDAMHIDFQKVFDEVKHKILVTKLGETGFSDALITFFSHVFNRKEAMC